MEHYPGRQCDLWTSTSTVHRFGFELESIRSFKEENWSHDMERTHGLSAEPGSLGVIVSGTQGKSYSPL